MYIQEEQNYNNQIVDFLQNRGLFYHHHQLDLLQNMESYGEKLQESIKIKKKRRLK